MNTRLGTLFAILWAISLPNFLYGQVVIPFVAPDHSDHVTAVEGKLKASLRFGYLKDNPTAESLRERREYNFKGYPTMIYRFNAGGQMERKEDFEYDASGTKILKASIEAYNANSDLEEARYYRFDLAGRMLEYKRESAKEGFSGLGNTYDPSGKLLVAQHFEKDRLPGSSDSYEYDAKGLCIKMIRRDLAGDIELVVEYAYNSKGKLEMESHFLNGNVLLYKYAFVLDANGRLSRKEKLGRTNEIGAWEAFKYDAAGRMIEKQSLDPGELKPMIQRNRYDGKGRLLEEKIYDNDGSLFQWFKYSHDSTQTGAGMQRLHADGGISMESMTIYDAKGRKLKHWTEYFDGSGSLKIEYRYDNSGLPLEEKHTASGTEQAVYWFEIGRAHV